MPPPKRLIHDDRIRSATPRDTWNSSISGRSRCRDMAQTRRMGMQNDWPELREAPRFSPCYGSFQNYRIGFGARFAFLFATLVASNWGIRIARWLREWARRNSSLEEPPSNPNAGELKCCSLSLVTSCLGYAVSCSLRPSNLLSVSGSAFERLTLCFIRAWSRQASAPNLPASVAPRVKPGARRLPKLSLLKGFLSCYRAESSARGGGLRISPSSWAVVRPVRIFQMSINSRRATATAAFFLSTLLLPPSTSRHCTTGG